WPSTTCGIMVARMTPCCSAGCLKGLGSVSGWPGERSPISWRMTSSSPIVHVVDDDDSVRTAVARLLRAAGYEVRVHASAGDFLLNRQSDRPGCVILDVRMPGPSGLDLQEAFAKSGDSVPIVFLSGHGDIPTSVRA